MTEFTRKSQLSGKVNKMELPITQADYDAWLGSPVLIQLAFPHLTPEQREFLITGSTQEEWDEAFGEDEDDQDGRDEGF